MRILPSLGLVFILLLVSACSKPWFVTHLTPEGIAMTKKKGYGRPVHKNFLSRIVCFDDKCRKKAAWAKRQRKDRFKGYESGPSLPIRERGIYKKQADSVAIAKKAPEVKPVQPTTPLVSAPAVVAERDSLIVLGEILFEVNSARLHEGVFGPLDSLVTFMQSKPTTRALVSGHTDNSGSEAHNQRLSEHRARVVAEYLIDRGIDQDRISFTGFGSQKPVDTNSTDKGRRRNRRVEVLIRGITSQ